MKEVSKELINEFNLKKLGYDFMAYNWYRTSELSFHHTIISHRKCKEDGLGEGYWKWNGSMLVQDTSHEYLHVIERVNYDMFMDITSELIDMNIKGKLDVENLRRIHDILSSFEKEYSGKRSKQGKVLIKEKYLRRTHL